MEQETDKTLHTAERINPVLPSEELMARLRQIPANIQIGSATVPKRIIWTIAASIALLIAINILSIKDYSNSQSSETLTTQSHFDFLNSL